VVDFTNDDGTWFTTGYSSYGIFQMDAYLTDGSRISVTGESNYSSPMDYLTLYTPENIFIDYVVLMGENGNNRLVDDMSGDTSGIDPDPDPRQPPPLNPERACFCFWVSRGFWVSEGKRGNSFPDAVQRQVAETFLSLIHLKERKGKKS